MTSWKSQRISLFLVIVFLFADLGVLANETDSNVSEPLSQSLFSQPILVEGLPPLMCGEELCLRPVRDIDRGERVSAEDVQWWQSYGPDLDWNGMDDRLQRVLAGADSVSPTSIIGPDGRKTVAIVIDYAWRANEGEIETLRTVLDAHGWVGEEEGAWFQQLIDIDSVAVDKVPVSALMDLYSLHGVVVIEMQNIMIPLNEVAGKASRARPSDVYAATAHERGYTGEGIVVAVLDTGVDNEHESLNDFDDESDEPDEDPLSYNDHKWVAGYDATSSASNPDGSQDPDDGNGHGTHVAGSAVGTGDSSRTHTGTAPGAYLVDIKVLTDTGGTNSQASLNGIQWLINNQDTDWGHNSSSRGIQVASMSFGSASTPLNTGDQGDNGSGSEARLVNDAVDASIVCVIAMGNDGTNRVPSPASADKAISIGAVTDRGSINRTDDNVADYSNSGPRLDDGDDDEWDELKPDITSYGSSIMSATAQTGTSFPGQPAKPLAGSDYDEKDGTSMATPIASGIVALMLQADPSLNPQEIKDFLRNSSEQRGSASEPSVSDRWNDEWGFGLIDASCGIDMILEKTCTPLEDNGGVTPPPTGNGSGDHVEMSKPSNGSWWIEGDFVRIAGITQANVDGDDYVKVQIRIMQHLESGTVRELQSWVDTGGDVSSWYLDVLVKDSWVRQDEDYVLVMARALTDEGDESALDARWVNIARMAVTIAGPPLGTALQGSVDFSGTAEGVEHDRLEYRIGSGDWLVGDELAPMEIGSQDWSFSWNSNSVDDGSHRISFRMVNESGVMTDDVRRTYTVDNQPAAPDFLFQGSVEIMDQDLPVYSAVAGTVLEVDFTITNAGDLDANDVFVQLSAAGSQSETYPRETRISTLNEGESQQVTLYWWATQAGTHDVTISIDPNDQLGDMNPSNNVYTFSFEVEERPVEAMLRFLPGSVTTDPRVPLPDIPFDIDVRIDNLGQTEATQLTMRLDRWTVSSGWLEIGVSEISIVMGSDSSSGQGVGEFNEIGIPLGHVKYRVLLEGNGVEPEFSDHRFTVVIDDVSLGSQVSVSLSEGEVPIDFIGMEDGGLLFTTRDGELHVRTTTASMVMQVDVMLEEKWGGELATYLREDGLVQAAWNRKSISPDGYTLTDLSMTSLTRLAETTPVHHQMSAIKLSEGSYWGLALTEYDDQMVLAGYHRDISTGGSWQDITSIFTLVSSIPDSQGSWSSPNIVLSDIQIRPSQGDALAIGLGEENLHILYQEVRNDVTGIERIGLMYTHGEPTYTAWGFQSSVGDHAQMAQLVVLQNGSDDVLVASWIEGRGKDAMLAHIVTDNAWSDEAEKIGAPGATHIELNPTSDGIQIFYDEINVHGPVTRYGLLSDSSFGQTLALSNILTEGFLKGHAGMEFDGILLLSSASGSLKMRTLADMEGDSKDDEGSSSLLDTLLAPLPGNAETKLLIFGVTTSLLFVFLLVIVVSVRSSRRREEELLIAELEQNEDLDALELLVVPVLDDGPLLAIDTETEDFIVEMETPVAVLADEELSLSASLEVKNESGSGNPRLNRRMKRKQQREITDMVNSIDISLSPLPPLPLELPESAPLLADLASMPLLPLPLGSLPPLPGFPALPIIAPPQRDVVCHECAAKFTVKDMTLTRVDCPICSVKVDC